MSTFRTTSVACATGAALLLTGASLAARATADAYSAHRCGRSRTRGPG